MARGQPAPVATAVVGMGGYAARILDLLLRQEGNSDHPPRVVAVTSSAPQRHPELATRLQAHGVAIAPSFEALLARQDVEAVWLPVPIDLHLPFLRQALAAGKPVLCEKPVAGCVDDCDRMIEIRDAQPLPVAIGYQDIYEPSTTALKRHILAGELGAITSVTLCGVWPRDSFYYGRADWSGRLRRNGVWVLDSPVQNALNHFINLTLFLLGPTPAHSALPVVVEAELYRANDIENYDTASLRLRLDCGTTFLVLVTHAAQSTIHPVIRLSGESGWAEWRFDGDITLQRNGRPPETISHPSADLARAAMVARFNRLVRGTVDPERAVATLETARAPLIAVNGTSEAAPVNDLPAELISVVQGASGATTRVIAGIEDLITRCVATGAMFHESGLAGWTVPAGERDLAGYCHFAGPFGWADRPAGSR
jgi:predicted dehydrogenase